MKIKNYPHKLTSQNYLEFIDLTDEAEKYIADSKIKNGTVLIYSTHTTVAIAVNEKEQGFFEDFKECISKLAPKDSYYRHNDLTIRTENLVCQSAASDCLNGHSHCTHLLIRNSETIPLINGKLALGTWQRLFAIELDCARPRNIIFQIMGN